MARDKIFEDKKIQKSLLNLKYLAYIFLIIAAIAGFVLTTTFGYKLYRDKQMELIQYILWELIFYVTTFMIMWGIVDVLKLLKNLRNGNIFTFENSNIIKNIDKKLVFTLFFSIISNIIMLLLNYHYYPLLIIWFVYISFILAAHILVRPLSLLVEKSAEMQLEMDLTI